MDHPTEKAALCEFIELPNGVEILRKARRLKFGIDASQAVALESRVGAHAPRQQTPTQRPITELHDVVGAAVGQNFRLDRALEQVIRRLHHVYGSDVAEATRLHDRKVAD